MAIAKNNTGFRPIISASLPYKGDRADCTKLVRGGYKCLFVGHTGGGYVQKNQLVTTQSIQQY